MTIMSRLRIGIDVGGTNTDCVLLDPALQGTASRGIIACAKSPTTADITTGIFNAIQSVLQQSSVEVERIVMVTIGTTHFLNAIIERDESRLDKVAIIRLSSSYSRSIPPFSDFPDDLKNVLYGYYGYVSGGLQIDGSIIAQIKEEEIIKECKIIREQDLKVVVVGGIYSSIDTVYQQEYEVKKIIQRELPEVRVVCSRDVGTVGFLERENSAILNGSILRFSEYVIHSFKDALQKLNLKCLLYLTQNDGTMISSDDVRETPIVTFSSGPTNSILGAAYLSQLDHQNHSNIVVVDVGGTTTDIGILLPSGFPKQASAYLTVAGVRINHSMPHIHSIGLGGGSIVRKQGKTFCVGPDSVGYMLTERSKVFGGDTLTTTDIASLTGNVSLENSNNAKVTNLSYSDVSQISSKIDQILTRAIDSIKTSQDDIPLILVGGGSIIIGKNIKGVSQIIKPKFHQHANAVGAAVAKVSHTIDMIVHESEAHQIAVRKKEALNELVTKKNAMAETCHIVDVTTLPVQYSNGHVRLIIKAAGSIDFGLVFKDSKPEFHFNGHSPSFSSFGSGIKFDRPKDTAPEVPHVPALKYTPLIANGVWDISQTDLLWIANGCYVLGCAGGGSPQCEYLEVRNILKDGYKIRVKQWETIKDDEIVGWGGIMGSPTVSSERLGGTDTIDALREIVEYTGRDCEAIMGLEIGGANGLQALLISSSKHFDKPLLDCDWMGRAYPTYYQTTLATHTEGRLTPAAISDGIGNALVLTKAAALMNSDVLLRAACAELGCRVGYSGRPTEGSLVKDFAVKNTYSFAWRIGRQIAHCQENNCTDETVDRIIMEAGGIKSAKKLFIGKIVSVEQKLFKAHSYGEIVVQAFSENESEESSSDIPFEAIGGVMRIPFKNEIIYTEHESVSGEKRVLASVPDLISVIDCQSGQAIGVPEFKFGLRVLVIAIACCGLWTDTEMSRELGGLSAFNLDTGFEHEPIGVYHEAKSVIEQYSRK